MYPDSLIILVLNGYFLERGEISILTKKDKTKIALSYGVDIVLSLPVLFGTQSADTFSSKAIELLYSVGVSKLVFGSECNDISYLTSIAKKQLDHSFSFQKQKSLSYPSQLAKSLGLQDIIPPNDLLGISYIKAILEHHYPIEPVSILRTNSYHDITSTSSIISASNIREKMKHGEDISCYLPKDSYLNLHFYPEKTFFLLLKHKILTDPHLEQYLDVKEGLEYKLKKEISQCFCLEDLLLRLKSKRYTFNYLNRMLIHIFLGILKVDAQEPLSYIPILGFTEKGSMYLKENRKNILLPTKCIKNSKIYQYELRASFLYDLFFDTHRLEN